MLKNSSRWVNFCKWRIDGLPYPANYNGCGEAADVCVQAYMLRTGRARERSTQDIIRCLPHPL